MKCCLMGLLAILTFAISSAAQEGPQKQQDLTQFDERAPSEVMTVHPDLVELVVELDPRAYGNRARTRTMQLNLELDPFVMGRATLSYQLKLLDSLMLDIPVYFEHSKASLPVGKWAGLFNENLDQYWGFGAGIGVKWRLSEWMEKSSFYVEPRVKVGYYSQKAVGFGTSGNLTSLNAITLTPELILGWERIFDSGFVIGMNVGVEKLIVFATQDITLPYVPVISVNPNIQLGYAW